MCFIYRNFFFYVYIDFKIIYMMNDDEEGNPNGLCIQPTLFMITFQVFISFFFFKLIYTMTLYNEYITTHSSNMLYKLTSKALF